MSLEAALSSVPTTPRWPHKHTFPQSDCFRKELHFTNANRSLVGILDWVRYTLTGHNEIWPTFMLWEQRMWSAEDARKISFHAQRAICELRRLNRKYRWLLPWIFAGRDTTGVGDMLGSGVESPSYSSNLFYEFQSLAYATFRIIQSS